MEAEPTEFLSDRETEKVISRIVHNALEEDIGKGDITALSIIPADFETEGRIIMKEDGIIAGLEAAYLTFTTLDHNIQFEKYFIDGECVKKGDIIARVKGKGRAIISGERVALNFLQRMSGIATATRVFVEKVGGTKVKILDTRKTAPGLRIIDKWAVKIGGGVNHRFGLYDMALIKENHIYAAGSVREAVHRVRARYRDIRIEVEVKTLDELHEALEVKPDRILLDNMDLNKLKKAVEIVNGKVSLESSGNVTLDNVADIANTGVDFISVGSLTHSVKALDISLLLNNKID